MNSNRWRNRSLIWMFGGFFLMYCGVYSIALLPYLLVLGTIGVIGGILLYFRYGPVNQRIQTVECPRCGHVTRLTGERDACTACKQTLRLTADGTYEPYID